MKRHPILLCALLIFALWLLRFAITGSLRFDFVVGNIFLAAIPLMIEPAFDYIKRYTKGYIEKACKLFTAFVWLLFLPNAFYVLTDFMHLNTEVLVNARGDGTKYRLLYERGDALFIYDSLLLFAATLFSAYVGGLTLLHAYRYLQRTMSASLAYASLTAIMILSSIGVYIGRYGRWNSWQGITHPYSVLSDLVTNLITPATFERFLLLLTTMMILQVGSMVFVHYWHNTKHKPL